ncbi:MAG: GNAT family N-acetyltransferase [Pseudomonadota bacterium]
MAEFHLETDRLIIRNWKDEDRDLFYLINSDETVMEFFPFRRDYEQSSQMMDRIRKGIKQDGFGFTALELKETGEVLGFCGLADATVEDETFEGLMEIGWRLAPQYWGKGYATESAKRLLHYGFEELELPEIVSFAVHNNYRSLSVMQRIGMTRDPSRDFDHPGVPDDYSHLKKHLTYFIENPNKKGA